MKCTSQFPKFLKFLLNFQWPHYSITYTLLGLNITKPPWCHPHSSSSTKRKARGHCCLGDLNMTKQDIGLQNFLNTRIFQWMYPQSLWHKCVVNHVPITCVTCFTWICVTIGVCWCDSCVDSCHLWCMCCKVGGLLWMNHNYI
jgi:hypothetical protein